VSGPPKVRQLLWIEELLTSLPGGQQGFLIFANAYLYAPGGRIRLHLRGGVLCRCLQDRFHHHCAAGPRRRQARDRSGLVWRADLRQHADELHAPPLGFALFYLRGIAPPTIKTSEIYWGAIPWVVLQVILVVIVIFWPGSVTYWLDKPVNADPSKIKIEIPQINIPAIDLGPPKIQ